MSKTVNLDREVYNVDNGQDGKVIVRDLADFPGGRALDTDGWPLSAIPGGTVIIKKSNGDFAPHPIKKDVDEYPKAAESQQTAGSAIVGTVYTEVESTTAGAVLCAFEDQTLIYLSGSAATGNAQEGTKYYTKDTTNKVEIEKKDENGDPIYIYGSLPGGASYVGVNKVSIPASKPACAITTIGEVNGAASPFAVTSTIVNGLPHIKFIYV